MKSADSVSIHWKTLLEDTITPPFSLTLIFLHSPRIEECQNQNVYVRAKAKTPAEPSKLHCKSALPAAPVVDVEVMAAPMLLPESVGEDDAEALAVLAPLVAGVGEDVGLEVALRLMRGTTTPPAISRGDVAAVTLAAAAR